MIPNSHFEPSSVLDPVGRIIVGDQGHLYRGIRSDFADQVRDIVRLAEANDWFARGLVPTSIADHQTADFPLVLEHLRLPFVTQRGEWPAQDMRKAALCHIDLSLELLRAGYCLKDAHTANIMFSGTTPYMIDFGSIRPLQELHERHWFNEFNKYFLAPLLLFAGGQTKLARALTREHTYGVGEFLVDNDPSRLIDRPLLTPPYNANSLEALRKQVSDLSFPDVGGEWHSYAPDLAALNRLKDRQILTEIEKLSFATAIDIGANRGLHSFMCAARGAAVLACDIEEACLNHIFDRADASGANIAPVFLDLVWPGGWRGAFGTMAPAHERLRCDLVLALALFHHVSFRQRYHPDVVIAAIADYTRHSALIEFVPQDDWHVAQWKLPPLDGYSLEGVQAMILRHFESVEHVPIEPAPRRLFVCQGKRQAR